MSRAPFSPTTPGLSKNIVARLSSRGRWLDLQAYYGEAATTLDRLFIDGLTFFQACHRGAVTTAVAFILGGVDPNALDVAEGGTGSGFSGLHFAVSIDDTTLAAILIDAGANVSQRAAGTNGMTPLMVALDVGAIDCVDLLLKSGASLAETDATGEPAIFYAANQPFVLAALKKRHAVDLRAAENDKKETLLHRAVARRNPPNRFDVLYLIEEAGIGVEVVDAEGETPLFHAVRHQEYANVAALLSKGARVSGAAVANRAGETPLTMPCKDARIKALLTAAASAPTQAALDALVAEDNSNWPLLSNRDTLLHVVVPLFVPNTLIVLSAWLPTVFGLAILVGTGLGFAQVAQFALRLKDRAFPTAGWFCGALFYGSAVLIRSVFPVFVAHNPTVGPVLVATWWVVTSLMFVCYLTAALRDPGVVQSTQEGRKAIFDLVAEKGKMALEIEGVDVTSLVKKPFRSKHCTKTHRTVARFDHYCVWTGNAIGGGNHRPFVWYCFFQICSQIIVMYTTFAVVFWYAPVDAGNRPIFASPCALLDWLFGDEMTLITYFLVLYNTALLVFVGMVMLSQLWYVTRNVTSNEVWFASRYRWMFMLGTRAYSFYDEGPLRNLVDFFWSGNLCAVSYTLPKLNDYLRGLSRDYAAQLKATQLKATAAALSPGTAAANKKDDDDVPLEITTSSGGAGFSPTNSGPSSPAALPTVAIPVPTGTVPTSPSHALSDAMANAPTELRLQTMLLQDLLGQLIRGNREPTFPASAEAIPDEGRARLLDQARRMHQQFQTLQAQQMQMQMQAQQQQQQQQQRPSAAPAPPQ
jgi:ankyrin repeat protein